MTINAADFDFVRALVQERSGIALRDGKEYLVEARLAPIAEREGVESVTQLVALVRRSPATFAVAVADALATNETSFFRDFHAFQALSEIVSSLGRAPTIWCAAASTGQEPYSVAMMLATDFPELEGATVLATDLSADVLRHAASGRYSQLDINRGLPATMLVRWFARQGAEWQLADAVRARVVFRQLNLARPLPALGPFDSVLLRNVLIYFEPAMKVKVLNSVATVLRPGGHLFLGAAETTSGLVDTYERIEIGRTMCYRLKADKGRATGRC